MSKYIAGGRLSVSIFELIRDDSMKKLLHETFGCFIRRLLYRRGRRCSRNCIRTAANTFYPIAVETMGPLRKDARRLLA